MNHRRLYSLCLVLALCLGATSAWAIVQPNRAELEEFRAPSMNIVNDYRQVAELAPANAALRAGELAALGLAPGQGYIDVRSNRWGTLMPTHSLLPGNGLGNELKWSDLGRRAPGSDGELKQAAWDAFRGYLASHQAQLRIDLDELPAMGLVTVHDNGNLIQIYVQREHQGLAVRGSRLTAVINHGNLILFGAANWGDVSTSVQPTISEAQAITAFHGAAQQPSAGNRRAPFLQLIPTARGLDVESVVAGQGFDYRLAWVLTPNIEGDGGRWEALIDAHTAEYLALQALNPSGAATTRRVQGGVLPASNDRLPPDGIEQAGWPMGWSDVTVGGETAFTDAGGNLGFCADGTATTTLDGQFMLMADQCGAISESSTGDIDMGTSGLDCTGATGGNTRASRSGFFEMNQIKALARPRLPGNFWVRGQLLSTMNINLTCNANWDGSGVNFYRSGGGCSNTGELAGVFDHEWGHGMDSNDAAPGIQFPSEGAPDAYAALRLNDSCMGRNFTPGSPCGGYGDPCTTCTGVRDIDWANRASGMPHDVTWVNANCGATEHCSGAVVGETVWDLFNRDLTAAPFSLDHNTALDVATRLSYAGMGLVGSWWTGAPPFAGCNADGGYLNYLAADDDDGSLANGTPHMSAIFDAFDRHEAACATPTVTNFGCAAGPSTAPVISSVDPLDKGAKVNFGSVAGADHYDVYRTDGVFGCDQGKIQVGEVADTAEGGALSFFDTGAQNGREYFYTVFAVGSTDACQSPASNCVSATPAAGPNLAVDGGGADVAVEVGDADDFVDNCEDVTVTFDINHIGAGTQTNVRIVSIDPVSHPTTVVTTALPSQVAASLAACGSIQGSISFQPRGLSFNDTFEAEVGVTSDELFPAVKIATISIGFSESDLNAVATKTFTFETDNEGWTVEQGTFTRDDTIGGADGTTWYQQSSAFLNAQCDRIRSPLMVAGPTSTMTLWNSFRIEPFSADTWYDRANIGIVDTADNRTLLTPDGGRLYNADSSGPGTYGGCNEPEEGWADVFPAWASSTWSTAAFGAVAPAGPAQLEVIYSTDPLANDDGFRFDQVTVTNVSLQEADGQSDACLTPSFIFADGFESGDSANWSSIVP